MIARDFSDPYCRGKENTIKLFSKHFVGLEIVALMTKTYLRQEINALLQYICILVSRLEMIAFSWAKC
jgi:hypothetical protein